MLRSLHHILYTALRWTAPYGTCLVCIRSTVGHTATTIAAAEGDRGAMTDYPFLDPPHLRSADSWPVRMTTLNMIDMNRVTTHVTEALKRGRYMVQPIH